METELGHRRGEVGSLRRGTIVAGVEGASTKLGVLIHVVCGRVLLRHVAVLEGLLAKGTRLMYELGYVSIVKRRVHRLLELKVGHVLRRSGRLWRYDV